MNNEFLIDTGKEEILRLLKQCTEAEQHMFKRMYAHKELDSSIEDTVANMDPDKIDQALQQCQATIERRVYGS